MSSRPSTRLASLRQSRHTTPRTPARASTRRRNPRVRSLTILCAGLITGLLWAAGAAYANSISLSVSPQPVQEVASEITYQASTEEPLMASVYVNAPGVPCAPNPAVDSGTAIVVPNMLTDTVVGAFSGAGNYTPPSTGAYTMCGWLTGVGSLAYPEGGEVATAISVPLQVRAPRISLSLTLPHRALPGKSFVLDVHATSQVTRYVTVEGMRLTRNGCPLDRAASTAELLLESEIDGGPWLKRTVVDPLPAGRYIFCAWADAPGDDGLYPQASASLIVTIPQTSSQHPSRKHGSRQAGRNRSCAEFSPCEHGGGPFGP